ncbi:FAD:protein FMN transferase [Amycolatopsis sp., V23-08]|uniref:FAD:protein FMN transferase n=1 Tax=Amycolatopsis heterodermiae TaxID=3110235 RepID=A0ABU5R1M9_9PSEU|nr:FAD:protein FMN transferase [Amycolatopsis sp., V23-08]MEA5360101.1 FAD:protein FMN transferase [Amycolatopsis sp., V23-08]
MTSFRALGTTAEVLVTDPARLHTAVELLRNELDAVDAACSRFRADSEISRLHDAAGRQVRVGPLLTEALAAALRAARLTGGLVDPTVGTAVRALGYDRDFAAVTDGPLGAAAPAPGWHRVLFDPVRALVVLPRGVRLDLGATAKALAADRAARRIHAATGCGTLVNLGGDLRVEGPAPAGGWRVAIGDDHADAVTRPDTTVTLSGGGLATSGTTRRRWRRGGRTVHHIVDPRTGDVASQRWRTVSVAAKSTVDANTASTAAVVLGDSAPQWLADRGLAARLVTESGAVVTTPGWPHENELREAS